MGVLWMCGWQHQLKSMAAAERDGNGIGVATPVGSGLGRHCGTAGACMTIHLGAAGVWYRHYFSM